MIGQAVIFSQSSPNYQYLKSLELADDSQLVSLDKLIPMEEDSDSDDEIPQLKKEEKKKQLVYVPMFSIANQYVNWKLFSFSVFIIVLYLVICKHYLALGLICVGWYRCYKTTKNKIKIGNIIEVLANYQKELNEIYYIEEELLQNMLKNLENILTPYLKCLQIREQQKLIQMRKVHLVRYINRLKKQIAILRNKKIENMSNNGWFLSKWRYSHFISLQSETIERLTTFLSFIQQIYLQFQQPKTQQNSLKNSYYLKLFDQINENLEANQQMKLMPLLNMLNFQLLHISAIKDKDEKEEIKQELEEGQVNEKYEYFHVQIQRQQQKPYYLTSEGDLMDFDDEAVHQDISQLKGKLNKIFQKKIEQMKKQEKIKQKEPLLAEKKVKYERRVEGFGMMFKAQLPKRNDIQYLE